MAIQPLSDLIFDVVRAADPCEYKASVAKLRHAQNANPVDSNAFAELTKEVKGTAQSNFASESLHSKLSVNSQNSTQQDAFLNQTKENPDEKSAITSKSYSTKGKMHNAAFEKFEAFMLQSFIENMFTTDSSSVFGKGQAGKIWRSMMSEAMGKEMAKTGGIGIAAMLEKNQEVKEKENTRIAQEARIAPAVNSNKEEMLLNTTQTQQSNNSSSFSVLMQKDKELLAKQALGHSEMDTLRSYLNKVKL